MTTILDRDKTKEYLEACELQSLFINMLGWDHGGENIDVPVDDKTFFLEAIANKRGLVVYQYIASSADTTPDYSTRRKIEKTVAKSVHEHIIIYITHDKLTQYWQWVKRKSGHPDQMRQEIYHRGISGEALIQKLEKLVFPLSEEEGLTIGDATARVRAAFDVEKVTKKFYDRFKEQHNAFLNFIEGLEEKADREWYASLMLNRLMFIYFIQKRGFLDNNTDYLKERLEHIKQTQGEDRFHTFYRLFLLRLFHEGLGQPETNRDAELANMLGNVPYLNGGLFDVHTLELDNPDINIPDEAFEQIFALFEQYQWHLDDRPLRGDNEINPDVLGYIFEKYINQKQMGAYYTKEDITGYISRNTIIPFLFNQAEKDCSIAYKPGGGIWRLLSDDPDRYIFETVRHGITYDIHKGEPLKQTRGLPTEIAKGLNDVSERSDWNKAALEDYGLPTETWREHVARRQRYEDVYSKLADGNIISVNDLITYNLDIEKFAEDVIANSEGPELVRAFWKALKDVSILDPTCGSGAFLFAALNILEPLYTTCLEVMGGMLDDLEHSTRKHHKDTMEDFREVREQLKQHANERYFILKSIIVNNLYGVDIMEEAVEICKLRLFLKLVAQLEDNSQLEPLPDIDFNVRTGNTLVGFTSLKELKKAFDYDADGQQKAVSKEDRVKQSNILKKTEYADAAFSKFREMQTNKDMDFKDVRDTKRALQQQLNKLREYLDHYLADQYGINVDDDKSYRRWRDSHQSFHWFAEFYGIMSNGGFNVIIGNPPYISASKVSQKYALRDFKTQICPDIYACVIERSRNLLHNMTGRVGMIVPMSLGFSSGFDACRRLLFREYSYNWFSSFGRIPSALFNYDVRVRNTVHLGHCDSTCETSSHYTTRLHRWFDVARPFLFNTLLYVPFQPSLWKYRVPKLNTNALAKAFEAALNSNKSLKYSLHRRKTKYVLHFKLTAYNWLAFFRNIPPATRKGNPIEQTEIKDLYFQNDKAQELGILLANGKLMFIYWLVVGDDFHVTKWNIEEFPCDFDLLSGETIKCLRDEVENLENKMSSSLQYKLNAGRKVGTYNLTKCRDITDKTDVLFARSLGLSGVLEDINLYYNQIIKTEHTVQPPMETNSHSG